MTTVWIFPGQGSQAVGMGQELASVAAVTDQLQQARQILGWDPLALDTDQISRTLYTQPALFMVSALLSDLAQAQGFEPTAVAGHSLGEYVALYRAGVFDFETGLTLVQQRALLMDGIQGGTMAAIIGFDRQALSDLCASTEGVSIANDNSPDQVVITGSEAGVAAVTEQIKAKRIVPLAVSGAFHSPFMAEPAEKFNALLAPILFHPARIPVYSNVTALASQDPDVLKANLCQQMTGSVRWRETVQQMADDGISTVWEIGPGSVLTGLVKRTVKELERVNIASPDQIPPLG
jgi:[acyl-carrier-protein] S-malonyltransferase